MFSGVVDGITGSRVILQIDMTATQTGSHTISAHRTARNNSNAYVHIFDVTCSVC